MDLNTLWFILIAVLYIGFFILEGFDFGVGILLPFIAKKDDERRMVINAIGPHWDGNEVWLLTAGGATFAAFPQWYATLFSGFYLPLFLLLVALIVRGVAFEFRSKDDAQWWRSLWDWCIFVGSLLPAILLGVAFANLLYGTPIDVSKQYVGGFFNLLNPYALLGGVASLVMFVLHGAIFLALKIEGELLDRVRKLLNPLWTIAVVIMLAFFIATYVATDILAHLGVNPGVVPVAGVAALFLVRYFLSRGRDGWAFIMTSLTITTAVFTLFMALFPRVMVSSLGAANDLTIYNTASGPYTLTVMTIVALIFVPIVLAYQGWSYWVFRQRVKKLVY